MSSTKHKPAWGQPGAALAPPKGKGLPVPTWAAASSGSGQLVSDDEGGSGGDGQAGQLADAVLKDYAAKLQGTHRVASGSCQATRKGHVAGTPLRQFIERTLCF